MFTYIYYLLIEKDFCEYRNVSVNAYNIFRGCWAVFSGYKFLTFGCIWGRHFQRWLIQLHFWSAGGARPDQRRSLRTESGCTSVLSTSLVLLSNPALEKQRWNIKQIPINFETRNMSQTLTLLAEVGFCVPASRVCHITAAMSSWRLISCCPAWILIGCYFTCSYLWLVTFPLLIFLFLSAGKHELFNFTRSSFILKLFSCLYIYIDWLCSIT